MTSSVEDYDAVGTQYPHEVQILIHYHLMPLNHTACTVNYLIHTRYVVTHLPLSEELRSAMLTPQPRLAYYPPLPYPPSRFVATLTRLAHHSLSTHRVLGLRFHCRDDILVCVDSSNAFRLLDVHQRRLAACQENVEFPLAPTGKGAWGGEGDVHPMNGVAFNPEDPLQSMLLFNHRCVFTTDLEM